LQFEILGSDSFEPEDEITASLAGATNPPLDMAYIPEAPNQILQLFLFSCERMLVAITKPPSPLLYSFSRSGLRSVRTTKICCVCRICCFALYMLNKRHGISTVSCSSDRIAMAQTGSRGRCSELRKMAWASSRSFLLSSDGCSSTGKPDVPRYWRSTFSKQTVR